MDICKERIAKYNPLEILDLKGLNLYEFPELPWHVTKVDLSNNFITEAVIPENLRMLNLSNNMITSIVLNKKMVALNLSGNRIKEITLDNPKLECLSLEYNELMILKDLEITVPNLKLLNVSYNQLVLLQNLPKQLKVLFCRNNKLLSLDLPETIEKVDCKKNNIVKLEGNTPNIKSLNCSNNKLDNIVIPPTVEHLDFSYNLIKEIPLFENRIPVLNYDGNLFDVTELDKKLASHYPNFSFEIKKRSIEDESHLYEFLTSCYDVTERIDTPISEFMSKPGKILIKLYGEFYGVDRAELLGRSKDRRYIWSNPQRTEYYIQSPALGRMIPVTDFKVFSNENYTIFILSKDRESGGVTNTLSEKHYSEEILSVRPFTVQDFISSGLF